jgi:Protein of unknown function (DUF2628)
MRVYTVYAPPGREREGRIDRIEFVRDGFRWLALFFPFLWLLFNRVWLPLLGYLVLAGGVPVLLMLAGTPENAVLPYAVGLNVLVGLEADALKRWSLERKGWRMIGVASGRDRVEAERAFFERRDEADLDRRDGALSGASRRPPLREVDMVGLFPEAHG